MSIIDDFVSVLRFHKSINNGKNNQNSMFFNFSNASGHG